MTPPPVCKKLAHAATSGVEEREPPLDDLIF
jgi:hypothetical protein